MANLHEIIQHIENFAPPVYQESYDNSNLLIGDKTQTITKVLLTLDCTESVVQEAIETGCELIIAHHPIIFKGLKSLTGRNYVERTIILAIKNNIAIYACHTNLDNLYTGFNAKIAERLGLMQTRVLVPLKQVLKQLYTYVPVSHATSVRDALHVAGAGKVGAYEACSFSVQGSGTFKAMGDANPYVGELNQLHEEAEMKLEVVFPVHLEKAVLSALKQSHPYEEIAYGLIDIQASSKEFGAGLVGSLPEPMEATDFLKLVSKQMHCRMIRHTAIIDRPISRVALCGGSGSFLLKDALASGADAYLTADFKYHEFFDAENRLMITDIGHYESEQFTHEIFSDLLLKKFTTFAVLISEVNTNPVNYYS